MPVTVGIARRWYCAKLAVAALPLALLTLGGCMPVSTNAIGLLYTETKGPVTATSVKETSATKTGTACEQTILALFATGDASIDTAKKSAGISEIISVDQTAESIVGVYAEYCVVVKGN